MSHPQSDGQAEVTNRTIIKGLETRLTRSKGRWAEELPSILWAYRTTPRVPTGETPFSLAFGTEAVVPVELQEGSPRIQFYDESSNSENLLTELDLLEERREAAAIRNAAYKQKIARYHDARIKICVYRPGDLVLRSVRATGKCMGKLDPNWEGPYRIRALLRLGAFKLEHLNGDGIPRTWNAERLRSYYL